MIVIFKNGKKKDIGDRLAKVLLKKKLVKKPRKTKKDEKDK